MASKKQRRRRDKERRHEYEYVYVDHEGHEVPADEVEPERANGKVPAERAIRTKSGRTVAAPSMRRVVRRGAIFAPLMLIIVYLLQGKKSFAAAITQTVILMVLFIPFSYLMDSLMYRSFRKRHGAKSGGDATHQR